MTKQLEVQLYIAKQYPLYAVRLDKLNMEAAALACGGTLFSWKTNKYSGEPYIRLATRHGHVKVRSGMWLVEQNGKWASFTDHNFHRKYEMPDDKQIKVITVREGGLPTELNYFDEAPPTNKTPSPYVREVKPAPTVQYQEPVKPSDADQQEIEDQIARARAVMGL